MESNEREMLVVAIVAFLIFTFSRRRIWLVAACLLVAIDSARLAFDGKVPSKMPQFFAHWGPAVMLCKSGAVALVGDGGPLETHWSIALLGTLVASVHFYFEVVGGMRRYLPKPPPFYIWAHFLQIILYGLLVVSAGSESLLRCIKRSEAAVARLRSLRQLLDPTILIALGVQIRYHQHDRSDIGLTFHATFGFLLICLSFTQLGSILVHAVLSHEAAASKLLRLAHSFAFLLSGVYYGTMGMVLYSTGSGGLHGWMAHQGVQAHDATEEGMTYLSLSMVLALLLLCALSILGGEGGGKGGAPSKAYRTVEIMNTELGAQADITVTSKRAYDNDDM